MLAEHLSLRPCHRRRFDKNPCVRSSACVCNALLYFWVEKKSGKRRIERSNVPEVIVNELIISRIFDQNLCVTANVVEPEYFVLIWILHEFFLTFSTKMFPLYSHLVRVLCFYFDEICFFGNSFHKKKFIFWNWAFLLRNCQIL